MKPLKSIWNSSAVSKLIVVLMVLCLLVTGNNLNLGHKISQNTARLEANHAAGTALAKANAAAQIKLIETNHAAALERNAAMLHAVQKLEQEKGEPSCVVLTG